MGKKIVISGYYGFGNMGDEAILSSIVRRLNEKIPDLSVTVLSASFTSYLSQQFNVKCVNRMSPLSVTREMAGADLFISGGGGLLQDVTGVNTVRYYLALVKLAKIFCRKVMYYAQGIGPLHSESARRLVRDFSEPVDVITVRDEESRSLLEDIGVSRPPVIVTADPVITLEGASLCRAVEMMKQEGLDPASGERRIAISVRPWNTEKDYLSEIASAASALSRKYGARIVLIPFQKSQDLETCEALAEKIEGAAVVRGDYTPEDLIAFIASMDFLIAMRLHALIFAASAETPMAGIVYDPKVEIFSRALDVPHWPVDRLDSGVIAAAAEKVLDDPDGMKKSISGNLRPLYDRSLMTAEIASELINGASPSEIKNKFGAFVPG